METPRDETSPAAETTYVVEEGQRLSQSFLWERMRRFYGEKGVRAWNTGTVPHLVTCNPYIARSYAKVVMGWLRDWKQVHGMGELHLHEPVHIIELGSGSGRFSYYFLKEFTQLYRRSDLQDVRVRYVMTDFAERNIAHFQAHPALKPFIESGMLDFALFDVVALPEIRLLESNESLTPETYHNPICVIANYVLDSIPSDLFSVKDGEIFESRVTLSSPQPEPNLDDPELLSRVTHTFEHHPITASYYDDPEFDRILQDYQQRLPDTTFLFPLAGLQCVRYFEKLSSDRILLLSADKGYDREHFLMEQDPLGLGIHGSAFSLLVNYHAIGEYFRHTGGMYLRPTHRFSNVCIVACETGLPAGTVTDTRSAFDDAIGDFGPDDYFVLRARLEHSYNSLTAEELLALIRWSGWEATIIWRAYPYLTKHLERANPMLKQELHDVIRRVWDEYFPIGEEDDMPLCLAMLLGQMEYFVEALEFLQCSIEMSGPSADKYYRMGICYYQLRDVQAAQECIQEALALNPSNGGARTLLIVLEEEMDRADRRQNTPLPARRDIAWPSAV